MDWLGYALIAVIVPAVLGALNNGARVPAEIKEGKRWLKYGWKIKSIAIVSLAFPIAGIVAFFMAEPEDQLAAILFFVFFGFISFPLLLETFFIRIAFDDNSVHCFSPWRPARQVAFAELGKPEFSHSMQWWAIPTKSNGYIRIPTLLSGGDELLIRLLPQAELNEAGQAE